jgi:predicted amidohydrolase
VEDAMMIDLWTCDVGHPSGTAEAFAEEIFSRLKQSWSEGADLVVFPEYTWMGLERFFPGTSSLKSTADFFWQELWPARLKELKSFKKSVLLGTAPYFDPKKKKFFNRAIFLQNGKASYQDKICLTPWEKSFSAGKKIQLFKVSGMRVGLVVCFDVEFPEIALKLKKLKLDLLLVPSACESNFGVERVGRCASARAIELGCFVAVSHLVGQCESSLVDENVGRLAFFAPSQTAFASLASSQQSSLISSGFKRLCVAAPRELLDESRKNKLETNPALAKFRGL